MINDPYYIFPDENGFKGTILDAYLAAGYYRMYHMIFTTNHTAIDLESKNLPVFWLRSVVKNINEHKNVAAILKKCASFTITCKKAAVTPEIETLYSMYYSQVNFLTSDTCSGCMYDARMENPFNSIMIEIRDGASLIAVGYFDLGKKAIAGILNFYHPAYKKYSLGKYLMLQKIEYALANNILYYYTGYISTAISKFDYKLFPDVSAIEVLQPVEKKWVPYCSLVKSGLAAYYLTHWG